MSTELVLLQLNIEYGGTGVDFDAVIAVIEASGAQVVALQEGCGNVPRVARALGWPFFDNRTQVVSTLPLLDPPAATAGVVYVELEPGRVAALVNVHPASRGYGTRRLAKGEPLGRVLLRERKVRVGELQPSLDAAASIMDAGVPVILLGDFNAPSHLDWTSASIGALPHLTQSVPWPTSIATEAVGLVDAYRAVYPDPVARPGLTWPADRPFVDGYNPAADGHSADRIDFMYVSPDVAVASIKVVGEQASPFTDLAVDPWPTDHRGLLASLQISAARPAPVVSASSRLVVVGDVVQLRLIADGGSALVVVPHGFGVDAALADVVLDDAGVGSFDTAQLGVGVYDVVAVDAGRRELVRTTLWVAAADTRPVVGSDRTRYSSGQPVTVSWQGAPGNRADWVAVFARGADPATAKPFMKAATGATVDGLATFDDRSHPKKWPLPSGEFTVHLLLDDLRISLAAADFDVN